jgi:hypothetical protein
VRLVARRIVVVVVGLRGVAVVTVRRVKVMAGICK